MKRSVSVGVLLSAVVCLAYGCGGDDDTTSSSPHAGSAGKGGGTGGKGGAGGSSAKGGTAGVNAGRGGTAGAPRGGNSGRGGTAGVSGAAGECTEEPRGPLAECPPLSTPDGDQGTVSTTCTFEDTCRELHCGDTWSQFDASGCRRPTCTASSQCDDDERCVSSLLVGKTDCYSSVFEGCEIHDCSCSCSASADCGTVAFCQPAADFPEAADCPLASVGCSDLPAFIDMLELWTNGIDTDDPTDLDSAVLACQHEAEQKLGACPGQGGEGGGGAGGQGGAGAGGQSGGGQSGGGVGGH